MRQAEVMLVCAKFRKAKSDYYCTCAVTPVKKKITCDNVAVTVYVVCVACSSHAGKDGLIVSRVVNPRIGPVYTE